METGATFTILHLPDAAITAVEDQDLRRLLFACFPHATVFITRRYLRRPPAHRWLARAASGELAGHVALHLRTISVGGQSLAIGGISEVCVARQYRGRRLVPELLAHAHAWLELEGIPFAMLFGQPRVYASSGYTLLTAPVHHDDSILSALRELNPFKGQPMIRPIVASTPFPSGPVDLLGPTF